jgi:imidazolonepropionase-like amidohydrolase
MAVRAGVDSIEHGLFLTPDDLETLVAREGMWVPTVLRMETTMAELRPGSSGAELIGRGLENVRKLLPLAAEMGLAVLTGTDLAIPVSAVSSEVAALVRCGLPPRAAVDGASSGGAAAAGLDMAFVVGRPADLVAFAGDPVDDPGLLTDPALVVVAGQIVSDRRAHR